MKGVGLYLAKTGRDGVTSCFVATMTNLIPSCSLNHAGGGMASIGSESVSLSNCWPQTYLLSIRSWARKVV